MPVGIKPMVMSGRGPREGESGIPDHLLDSAALLSKKWHPAILHLLADRGPLGFSDLEDRLTTISAKVLTDALADLQESELIERRELQQRPLRVQYALTRAGKELAAIVDSLATWGEQYLGTDRSAPVVLIAEDNRGVAEMHTTWLESDYQVRLARDGDDAIRELDQTVDVVLLDRRMPGRSGSEVLQWIKSNRYDCRVALITSRRPTVDDADLAFDAYLTKPVREDDLRSVVADLIDRLEYDPDRRELLALRSRLAVLESELSASALEGSDEYRTLRTRYETLKETLDGPDDAVADTLDGLTLSYSQ